jgi:hypothetical protein
VVSVAVSAASSVMLSPEPSGDRFIAL